MLKIYFNMRYLHTCIKRLRQLGGQPFRPAPKQHKSRDFDSVSNDLSDMNDDTFIDDTLDVAKRNSFLPIMGHQILIIHPAVKWGQEKVTNTTPQLQLEEAVALAKTLPDWKVVDSHIIRVKTLKSVKIFGSGNFDKIKQLISQDAAITSVFINVNMLSGMQHQFMEEQFQLPIFDRFTIVLRIFRDHAKTKEAMLQIALAEIPYLRSRLREMHEKSNLWHSSDMVKVGGSGRNTFLDTRKQVLMDREVRIKNVLEKLKMHRKLLRSARFQRKIPIIAVVGYTNAGKTSLIKSFTNQEKLIPKNQLFATLDVTAHGGKLPCNLKVIFMDTVGFISNIPTTLIASFNATLEDICLSDLILHVRDLSHPDYDYQNENVMSTLRNLDVPSKLLDTMIEVNNKVDMCDTTNEDAILSCHNVSCTKATGLTELLDEVEKRILQNTNQVVRTIRVRIGSDQERWLRKECGVKSVELDPDRTNNYKMQVVLSKITLAKFCHNFNVKSVKS